MAVIEIAKIQIRRGQEGITGVPQLDPGEFGWAEDTQNLYLGKRISEGANSDDNARILTDKDLKNIFDSIGAGLTGSAASTSTYRYRNELPYNQFASTTTTIARKLDDFVNLTDFSSTPLYGDITNVLKRAVENLYSNNYLGTATIRPLKIPGGSYFVSDTIDLPPHAELIGDGKDVTILTFNNAGVNMFRTVDALGVGFNGNMQFDNRASKGVKLSNMTLSYVKNNVNNAALISLDNTENPVIENIKFKTEGVNLASPSFVSTGTAIAVKGSIGVDESTIICRDIQIKDCQFEHLNIGVYEYGAVSRPIIENNVFSNLHQGIVVTSSATTTVIPTNTIASKNKFRFIYNDAIHVTENINKTNFISSDNVFYCVGNYGALPDHLVTFGANAVITFGGSGNISSNDYFHRKEISNSTSTFYYNALVNGNARIESNETFTKTIDPSINNQPFLKIPLIGKEQVGFIEYQLSTNTMSRKGRLTVNISYDGFASVSDQYNYSEETPGDSDAFAFSTNMNNSPYTMAGPQLNYISITCSSQSALSATLEYTYNLIV